MGRGRKNNDPFGLAGTRLAFRSGRFYYWHRGKRWEDVGTDVAAAKKRAKLYNDPSGVYGTIGYLLFDMFIVECEQRVRAQDLAQRTLEDYTGYVEELKVFFGSMLPEDLAPSDVQTYLAEGRKAKRDSQANRERACLSSCITAYSGRYAARRFGERHGCAVHSRPTAVRETSTEVQLL